MIRRKGASLLEGIATTMVVVLIAAIAVPKLTDSGLPGREKELADTLIVYRSAIKLYHDDCGAFPEQLENLCAVTPPRKGIDSRGQSVAVDPGKFKGPYLTKIRIDPVSSLPFKYVAGTVRSSATGKSTKGTPYSAW